MEWGEVCALYDDIGVVTGGSIGVAGGDSVGGGDSGGGGRCDGGGAENNTYIYEPICSNYDYLDID